MRTTHPLSSQQAQARACALKFGNSANPFLQLRQELNVCRTQRTRHRTPAGCYVPVLETFRNAPRHCTPPGCELMLPASLQTLHTYGVPWGLDNSDSDRDSGPDEFSQAFQGLEGVPQADPVA